jgi:uncharacterized protein with PQ loop repeat
MASWVLVIGYVAATLQVVRAVPQLWRLRESRSGVSVASWSLAVASGEIWFFYGVRDHLMPTMLSNSGSFVVCFLIVAVVRTASTQWRTLLYVVPPLALLWAPTILIGIAAVAVTTVMIVPQAVDSVRGSVAGVSATTWSMAFAGSSLWDVYALYAHSWEIIAPSIVIIPLSLFIVLRVLGGHRSARRVAQLDGPEFAPAGS